MSNSNPFVSNYICGGNNTYNSVVLGYYNTTITQQYDNAVAIGNLAGQNKQSSGSIAIGYQAGTTGQGLNSIAIGQYSGRTNQSANSIIINATSTDVVGTTANSCYVAPIRNVTAGNVQGNLLVYDSINKEILYTSNLTFGGSIAASSYFSTSDSRLKTNIQSFPPVLDKVKNLEPVQFDWKKDGKSDYGFIAQQFYREFDFLKNAHNFNGEEFPCDANGSDVFYSMEYPKITAILCKAIQELDDKITKQIPSLEEWECLQSTVKILQYRLDSFEKKKMD